MNPERLRTLIAIADHKGFAIAAEKMFRTPAAISQQMKTLEDELGVTLFDRTTRPPRLNSHGQYLAERARVLVHDLDAFTEAAHSPGEIAGTLKLGCINGVSSDLLPRALAALKARHPRLTVRMEEGMSTVLSQRVIRRDLDAAVITEVSEPDPALRSLPILIEPMYLVAPENTKASNWREALAWHPFLATNKKSGMGQLIDRTRRRAGFTIDDAMELDSSDAIIALARAGLGVGVVPAGRLAWTGALKPPPTNAKPRRTEGICVMTFGKPHLRRQVALIERGTSSRQDLSHLLYEEIKRLL